MVEDINQIVLQGRLSAVRRPLELPSGDEAYTFAVIVDRPKRQDGRAQVDTIDCVAWTTALRNRVAKWTPGDRIRVEGSVRRRFWQTGGGSASRCEVEVRAAKRVERVTIAG